MTELLEQAIAALILEEIEDETRWDEAFRKSQSMAPV
jgi:hypothetical protein